MKRLSLFLLIALAPAAAWAVNGASYASGISLLLPRGARPVGLGGAYVAVASGADSILQNPAGMNQLRDLQLNVDHLAYIQDISDDALEIARPIYGLGAWGVGVDYLNLGTQKFYDSFGNDTGSDGSSLGTFNDQEVSVQFAFSVQLPYDMHAGLTYKILHQEYSQSAMGSAFDLGFQARNVFSGLDLGFVWDNLGTPLAVGSGYSNLAMALKGGLAWHLGPAWLLAVDYDFQPWTQPGSNTLWTYSYSRLHAGLEKSVQFGNWIVAARAGYVLGPEQDQGQLAGLSVGAGINVGAWNVDYAWTPMGDLGMAQRLSVSYSGGN